MQNRETDWFEGGNLGGVVEGGRDGQAWEGV